jgi:hypothetical protein
MRGGTLALQLRGAVVFRSRRIFDMVAEYVEGLLEVEMLLGRIYREEEPMGTQTRKMMLGTRSTLGLGFKIAKGI